MWCSCTGGGGPSMEEMSPNNRAGMQLQLQHSATCALMQEACEQRLLYTLHDLMLMMRLWMAPPLFIVSAALHVAYHACGTQAILPGPHCSHLWQKKCRGWEARQEKKIKNESNKNREGGVRGSPKCDLTSEELCWWFMLLHMQRFTPCAAVQATCAIWFHNFCLWKFLFFT